MTARTIGEGEAAIQRPVTGATINRALALLRHLLRLAHEEWELLDAVPRIGWSARQKVGYGG